MSEISLNGNMDIKLQVAHYKVTTAIWRVTLGPIMPAGWGYVAEFSRKSLLRYSLNSEGFQARGSVACYTMFKGNRHHLTSDILI